MKKLALPLLVLVPTLAVACGSLVSENGLPDDAGTVTDRSFDEVQLPEGASPIDATLLDATVSSDASLVDASDASDASLADAADASEPDLTFAVIGDFGSGSAREAAVAQLVASWSPAFVVTTGDNNYGAADDVDSYDPNVGQFYHSFIAPYAGAYGAGATSNAFFPAIGNHDWDIGGGASYFTFFTLPGNERYYELARGPVRFVFLDSDAREPDGRTPASVQGAWAEGRMAAATEPFVFVVFHHPAYTSGTREPAMLWPFKAWGADAVLTGHVHNYERLTDVGLTYFVNGQGGHSTHSFGTIHPASQLRYNAQDGAQRVTVSRSKATFQYFGVDGSLIDSYAMGPDGQSVPP